MWCDALGAEHPLARVCGGGRQGWRLPNCKGAVPTDSANCSCAPSLLVGVWGAAARSGGDVCRAIGGAEALKNSVLLPLAFPRSTPILMRSRLGCALTPSQPQGKCSDSGLTLICS